MNQKSNERNGEVIADDKTSQVTLQTGFTKQIILLWAIIAKVRRQLRNETQTTPTIMKKEETILNSKYLYNILPKSCFVIEL